MGDVRSLVAHVVIKIGAPEIDVVNHSVSHPKRLMVRVVFGFAGRSKRKHSSNCVASRTNDWIERWFMASQSSVLCEQMTIDFYDGAAFTAFDSNFC